MKFPENKNKEGQKRTAFFKEYLTQEEIRSIFIDASQFPPFTPW